MKKKHIIITQLFETGGSNSHLKLLLNYFGESQVLLVLESENEKAYLNSFSNCKVCVKIISCLKAHAHLQYRFTTNAKELVYILKSLLVVFLLSAKNNFADITISCVEPEKFLYFLWLPFIKTNYILHTEPTIAHTSFTTYTCNHCLGRNKKIISVSAYLKDIIISRWSIDMKKEIYIPIIYNSLTPDTMVNVEPINKPCGQLMVLTIGRIDTNKNPDIWIKTAKKITATHKNVVFIWIGSGPRLEESILASNDAANIHFVGLIKNPYPYLKSADVYFQPSFQETHGIAVLEAMQSGLPCVVSNVGGLTESVSKNHNGLLINPLSESNCINAINILLNNLELRNIYGANSSKRYESLFSYAAFKSKMDAHYRT